MSIQMAESTSNKQQAREISPEKSTTINLDWIPSVLSRQHQIVDII